MRDLYCSATPSGPVVRAPGIPSTLTRARFLSLTHFPIRHCVGQKRTLEGMCLQAVVRVLLYIRRPSRLHVAKTCYLGNVLGVIHNNNNTFDSTTAF